MKQTVQPPNYVPFFNRVSGTGGFIFRAWVAAQRHLEFEMDPRDLTTKEIDILQCVANWWKGNRF